MTKFFNIRTILAASAVSAAAAASMFAQTGSASAGVLDCRGNSPNAVLECCQQEVRQNGRPKWMREAHASCNTGGIACKGGGGQWQPVTHAVASVSLCKYIKISQKDPKKPKDHETKDTKNPKDNTRDTTTDANNPTAF